ncbi:DAK2 domain-containing protein [Puerhibacterium sp. TATVAM-FAB25]|uniref:DAK2 domain-containing protein n=1 Tax=Puerhibacterium sp. TATVAM-FAB25 TaxID=3093699 RepID=UPI00397E7EFF
MTDELRGAVVRAWASLAVGALARERTAIDRVNVFPVADGDTGTNLHLTLREGARALAGADAGAGGPALLRRLARGALLGARGNSGVILSEWLRGLAAAATHGDALAVGLDRAARTARAAVAHPEPGTILTAADVAAAAARHAAAAPGAATDDVLAAAVRGAREAASSSVATLAPLARAGVLDAGACGLVLVLDALAVAHRAASAAPAGAAVSVATAMIPVVTPTTVRAPAPVTLGLELAGHAPDPGAPGLPGGAHAPGHEHGHEHGHGHEHEHGHADADELEVMFVLRRAAGAREFAEGEVARALRADLDRVGGSVVVVGGAGEDEDSVWQAHVHTTDLDAALAVAREWARHGHVDPAHVRHLAVPEEGWGVVAVTGAPALAAELARGGAVVLLPQGGPVTPDDVALAALGTGSPVLVLPAGVDADAVRAAVARRTDGDGPDGAGADGDGPDGAGAAGVVVVPAPTDAHVAVGVATLAGAADLADPAAVVRRSLAGLRVATADAAGAEDALARLLGAGPAAVVTVLTDADLPEAVAGALAAAAEAATAGAEVVVLPTGRPGGGVTIAVEGGVEGGVEDGVGNDAGHGEEEAGA